MGNQVKAAKTQASRLLVAPVRHRAVAAGATCPGPGGGSEELRRRCGPFGQCGDACSEQAPHLILFAGIQPWPACLARRGEPLALATELGGCGGRSTGSAGLPIDGACAPGSDTSPRRSRDARSTFIDCRVTKAPRASSEVGQARSLGQQLQAGVVGDRHAQAASARPPGRSAGRSRPPSACTPAMCPARLRARLDSCQ